MSDPTVPHILVVDDQPDVLEAVRLLLKGHGYDVDTVNSPGAALAALERRDYDAMLLDMNYARDTTSGREGLDFLLTLQGLEPNMPVVVMTAWGSIDNAVEAMRRGARDYVEKPWDNARLMSILATQVELGRALRRAQRLESENRLLRRDKLPQMVAESPKMKPVLQLMERVGPSDANVLITGEHGTGKELVAQWLHAASPRAPRSFIAVNMGGLSEGLFESELFGHVKGAFTDAKTDRVGRFELADGGSIFLDEIGTVPLSLQSKLLRVLQTGDIERVGSSKARHVDARVISATNANLQQEVAEGAVPGGFAVPAEHDRDQPAVVARPARGHRAAGGALSAAARRTVSQAPQQLRRGGDADAAQPRLAGQHPRARPRSRAGGADGAGRTGARGRPRAPRVDRGGAAARGPAARGR
jgi:DNA-binding NtrC family response regulator